MEYEHGNISYMSSSMSHSASSEASRIEGGNKMEDCGIIRHRMRLSVGDTTCGDTANVIGDVRRVLMPQTQAGLKDHYVLHVTLSHCSREEACLWLALLLTTSEKTIKKRGGEQGENGTLIRPRSIGI